MEMCVIKKMGPDQLWSLQVRIYKSQDTNINEWWLKRQVKNITDVGVAGRWYQLERSFIDYDINQEDIEQLPE